MSIEGFLIRKKRPIENVDNRSASTLTPEQKKRMEENRLQALKKRKQNVLDLNTLLTSQSWRDALKTTLTGSNFTKIETFLVNEYLAKKVVYPPKEQIFSAYNFCADIEQIRVVIIGQDPYHGPKQAHGLSFSVQNGTRVPPSLNNIYKELQQDEQVKFDRIPTSGDLSRWAAQGVFLLNNSLTVLASQPASHAKIGWEAFTNATITALVNRPKEAGLVVFILWGRHAQSKEKLLKNTRRPVHIIKSTHPSPFSAHKGFFGSRCFSRTNTALSEAGLNPINWNVLNEPEATLPKNTTTLQ